MTNDVGSKYKLSLIAAIVMLSLLATALVLAIVLRGFGPNSTPALSTIIGFFAPTIGVFLVLLHGERRSNTNADRINGQATRIDELEKLLTEALGTLKQQQTHVTQAQKEQDSPS